jgi:transferase family protein
MTELLERHLVSGHRTSNDVIPLTAFDIFMGHYMAGGVRFFSDAPNFHRMKGALSFALDRYPSYAGRLIRDGDKILLLNNNHGAELSLYSSEEHLPNLHSKNSLVGNDSIFNENLFKMYSFGSDEPISKFRLILFRDRGAALIAEDVHSQADGSTFTQFLQCWGAIYNNDDSGLPPISDYSRKQIFDLATEPGEQPSTKLKILSLPTQPPAIDPDPVHRSAIRVEVKSSALDNLINRHRNHSSEKFSSSDLIHALAWQSFALANSGSDTETTKLYTLFDLRGVRELGIPLNYEGNAIVGRGASASRGDIRHLSIDKVATLFRRQIKPLTETEARQDISYLTREYLSGNIDAQGHYRNFVIEAWLDCVKNRGLVVNDIRFLTNANIVFESPVIRYETLTGNQMNIVSVYSNCDETTTFHYVGETGTLNTFSEALNNLII